VGLAGGDQVPDLGAVEGDGEIGLDGGPGDLAARRVDPGRDVAGDDRGSAAIERLDRGRRRAVGSAGRAGAEHRVDHGAGPLQLAVEIGGIGLAGLGETVEVGGGVAGELVGRAEQQRPGLETGVAQVPGGDEAVAAVVPLAADQDDRPLRREADHRLGQGPAGCLHQLE
jgi:hypothetical protein